MLWVFQRYLAIKSLTPEERKSIVIPRVVLFAGKAAPGCQYCPEDYR